VTRPPARSRWTLALIAAAIVVGSWSHAADFVVHEWGTFTTHHGADGEPVLWMPLQDESDLPTFVYHASVQATRKNTIEGTVRMETPVIYFYGAGRQAVSVSVGFPSGLISEWYPRARKTVDGMRWPRVTLLPGVAARLRNEGKPSHYYPARETDSSMLRSSSNGRTQHEKFLFYRGVGTFDVPLRIRRDGDAVRIGVVGPDAVASGLLLERQGDAVGFRTVELASGEVVVDRPVPASDALAAFEDELRARLVAEGLYEREAEAMLNTWRATWSEDGLRVLYVVPDRLTDAVLPLTITPSPTSIERVLVGRAEVLPPDA
jgi:hypothetical protein